MADDEKVEFRFVLRDEGGGDPQTSAPAPNAPQVTPPPAPREVDEEGLIHVVGDSAARRRRDDHDRRVGLYQEAQQFVTAVSRGAFFASRFGLEGAVGAAGQFLEAGQSFTAMRMMRGGMAPGAAREAASSRWAGTSAAAGVAVAALYALAKASEMAAQRVEEMTRRYEMLSGPLAQATATSQVEQIQQDLQQANLWGEMLGEQRLARDRFQREVEVLKNASAVMVNEVRSWVYRVLTPVLDGLNKWLGIDKDGPQFNWQTQLLDGIRVIERHLANDVEPGAVAEWMNKMPHLTPADIGVDLLKHDVLAEGQAFGDLLAVNNGLAP